MAPQEIPGFYYDPEKKKYFQIQANHVAPPGASYSNDGIKRRRTEEKKEIEREQLTQRIQNEKVSKEGIFRHPLINGEREIGSQAFSPTAIQDQQARAFASQLRRTKLCKLKGWDFDLSIKSLVQNPWTGDVFTAGQDGSRGVLFTTCADKDFERRTFEQGRLFLTMESTISSLSLSSAGYILITTESLSGDSWLIPHRIEENGDLEVNEQSGHAVPTAAAKVQSTLFCSAACPTKEKALFAVGTSEGLHTLNGSRDRWSYSDIPFPQEGVQKFNRKPDSSHACVTAVDWLSTNVIAAGLRDSTVFLHDLRSKSSAARLQHPHTVSKLLKVDEHRIMVAGHEILQLYDVRFAPNGLQRRPNPIAKTHTATRPCLTFQGYSPAAVPQMDISSELGLLASGSENGKVQLFSLKTGTEVASPFRDHDYSHPIEALLFSNAHELSAGGSGVPSLLIGSNKRIDEWKW
ncbi:uncharacterized protein N7484_006532 [Penicillium longicatenatum]|uniref:uncharacterized protein n=1 Tax=Penicillium longicatenatum TaxID=1561947 RepID=UPI0025478551|nr:uncharacterized protein N7484_006532 [Penicillium longicatenatum]KAJ5644025.1 hypothetical protein N7484_006532 [Penicillium longicatenatum]